MDKEERKFNAWVRAHEEELMFLMEDPKKWELVENLLSCGCADEDWENNPIRPILESYRKVQHQMEDDLEERIFEAADKLMPSQKTPEQNPTNSDSPGA